MVASIVVASTGLTYSDFVVLTDMGYEALGLPHGSIMSYQQLLISINAAYAAAYALIPVIDRPAGSQAPQFIWNPTTQLIELFVDPSYVGVPPALQIAMTQDLQTLLNGFVYNFQDVTIGPYAIVITTQDALIQPAPAARVGLPQSLDPLPAILYKVNQQATMMCVWNTVRSVIILSSLIPARPEFVPTSTLVSNNSVSSATQRIISDFLLPPEDNPLQGRCVLEYLPTAEYRMIDLRGKSPMYSIDLQMVWTDFRGRQYPLILKPGATFAVKIMFRRKGWK